MNNNIDNDEKKIKKINKEEQDKSIKKKIASINMTTKEKILYASLTLFSQQGYEGVTMRDIASAVDIKGSSIYKHFESKQKIFESIIEYMNQQYEQKMIEMHVPTGTIDEVVDIYCGINKEGLYDIVKKIFHYYLSDDYASKFRKILVMEQYRNTKIGELFIKIYYENALEYQEGLFQLLINKGYFRNMNAHTMALQFYAPIFLLITVYDQSLEKVEEAEELIRKHVYQFSEIYQL